MIIVILCAICAIAGFVIGLSLAGRIAENKLEELRAEAGLGMEPEDDDYDELYREEW